VGRAMLVSILALLAACGAPPATVPSATATATATAASSPAPVCAVPPHQAAGPVLYSNDLSARCAGSAFGSEASDSITASPDSAGYRVILKTGPGIQVGAGPEAADYAVAKTPDNARIEVDAERVTGSDKTLIGFECRVQLTGRSVTGGYRLAVAGDGTYEIARFGASPQILASGLATPLSASKNHLMAECLGSKLALFVNGKQIASSEDGAISTGLMGIYARTLEGASTEILFTNFVVTGP
jgi:hypothetical protein